jgi:hypothetical protein
MAIEGPLRELGIHDVFQLLDLSRKTGVLCVSSKLREDEGVVHFDDGSVVHASIRSKSVPIELVLLEAGRITQADLDQAHAAGDDTDGGGRRGRTIVDSLVQVGAITQRELERQLRLQIESVVFELMSWREGFFSFEERSRDELPRDTRIAVSTESLLMEGARRIDEWSRIADVVPNLDVVPELAPVGDDRGGDGGPTLDLLPHEWQVLTMIDGDRDLRAIAALLGRDEFETAKIAYGLATTGVVAIRQRDACRCRNAAPPRPDGRRRAGSPRCARSARSPGTRARGERPCLTTSAAGAKSSRASRGASCSSSWPTAFAGNSSSTSRTRWRCVDLSGIRTTPTRTISWPGSPWTAATSRGRATSGTPCFASFPATRARSKGSAI